MSGYSEDGPVSLRTQLTWIVIGAIAVTAAVGLLRVTWWGWALAGVWALANIGFGLYGMWAFSGDITMIGAPIIIAWSCVAPGLVLAGILLHPATIRWFRQGGQLDPPRRPDIGAGPQASAGESSR